ncbi:MAG TPA: UDP-N-acetylmuramate dehydrogenase [Flavitalea sp.]|nr:UDP-N-acetylmuramate dehydrogenase [Flavitalea sp.]
MNISRHFSLRSYNSFGIDARTDFFSSFHTREELEEILAEYHTIASAAHKDDILILGGGSNILFTRDYPGITLKNEIRGITAVREDDQHIYLKVGAGENWHGFVRYCIDRGFAGVENLSLIPGNAGASPMQNIGAYGVEIKDLFHELEAFHIKDKALVRFSAEDCRFGYRDSVFKHKYKGVFVILQVVYRLNKTPVFNTSYGAIEEELERMKVTGLSLAAISQAVINIRSSKLPDPGQIGNAGSFFKNPTVSAEKYASLSERFPGIPGYPSGEGVKLAAGWMIEQCGWKGYRSGDAGCHSRQALVLVNHGNASGKEINELSERIAKSVQEKFEVTLDKEVNII